MKKCWFYWYPQTPATSESKFLIESSKMDIARMKKDYTSIWNYE